MYEIKESRACKLYGSMPGVGMGPRVRVPRSLFIGLLQLTDRYIRGAWLRGRKINGRVGVGEIIAYRHLYFGRASRAVHHRLC